MVGGEITAEGEAQEAPMSTMRIETLDNGLVVLLQEQHTVPVATFWVWYRVGSRNEIPGLTGISHWVEHMLFKGTPTHPKGMLTRHIDRLGGRWNAFTWKDYTAYHEVLPAEHLGVAIRLEADRMANTIMERSEVESERTVIISEREGSENYPSYLLREEVDSAAHKVHPYRIPVIGWKDDLRTMARDDLYQYYRTYYHPNNAVAIAVGPFDANSMVEPIRQAFADVPAGPTPPKVRVREPQQEGERRVVLRRSGGATAYLHIAFHVPAASHPDLAALLVADGLLSGFKSFVPFDQGGGGRSSRLYRALVDGGLASDASSVLTPSTDPTVFRVMATARAGVDTAALERRTLDEVARLAHEAAGTLELEKVKKQAKAQFVFSRDGVFRTAMGLGAFTIVDGPEAFASLLTRIDLVSSDDVLRVADAYFTEKNRTVGWYLPEMGATTATAQAALRPEVFFVSQPAPHPPASSTGAAREGSPPVGTGPSRAQVQAPPITAQTVARTEMRNGLVALVKETRGTGMIAVHGYIKAGAMYDGERSGLARYVAAMLQRGTGRYASHELAERLDGLGASLVIRADTEVVGVSLRALAEDAAEAFRLLSEVLIRPTFPPEEIEKARGELLTSIRIGMQDTRLMAERTFRRLLFPESHPHRQMPDGEEAVIASLARADLEAFHRDRYRPEAALFAVVGDTRRGDALATIEELFSPWSRRDGWALPPVPPVPRPAGALRGEHRMEGKTQSDIVLGAPGMARTDPSYYETMMANLILGQLGMMGRLGDRVRERQGMAYYAFSDLRAGLLAGPWVVRAGVNPANEHAAIEGILAEIRRFQDDGPEDAELADARDFLIGSQAVRLETNPGIAQMLADIELFELGLDYLVRYPGLIRGIARDAIMQAARKFPKDSYCLAIAGPHRA